MKRRFKHSVVAGLLLMMLVAIAAGPACGKPSAGRQAALDRLRQASQAPATIRLSTESGTVQWLTGRFAAPVQGRPVESSFRFLEKYGAAFAVESPRANFSLLAAPKDDQLPGWRDVYLQQRIHGIPVPSALLAFHYDGAGKLIAVSGDYVPTDQPSATPKLDAAQAVSAALKAVTDLPAVDSSTDALALAEPSARRGTLTLAQQPRVRLVYFVDQTQTPRLAYEVELVGTAAAQAWTLVVDARSGAILSRTSDVETIGRGVDLTGHKVTLKTTRASGKWSLIDQSQYMFKHHSKHKYTKFQGSIEIRDAMHVVDGQGEGIAKPNYPVVKDANNDDFFNSGGNDPKKNQRSAVSLARNLATTYTTLRAKLGRNSVDDKGISLIGNVHLGRNYENAYWDDSKKMMFFGDNAPGLLPYAGSLDAVAHELGHGITHYSVPGGGLVYQYPSGALSEAYSDIWGSTVDYKNWTMGEAVGPALRDLANPAANNLPASMYDYKLEVLPDDNGGNHDDCTIGGHFFQQLAAALPATPPASDGRFAAARIVYRSYAYMNPRASYRTWAIALSQAASDVYGAGSSQAVATNTVLAQLGLSVVDFGQNDNGWCLDKDNNLIAMQWTRAAEMCYLAEKFTAPAGAQLARVYLALDNDPSIAYIAPGQALRVFVVGVAADGGPDLTGTAIDYETLTWDQIDELGQFTPVSMTMDDFKTPRTVAVPQQFFLMVGFFPDDADESTMLLLQDDGSTPGPSDQNWVVSSVLNFNDFSYSLKKETLSQWSGVQNTLNFMIRPMYSYGTGTQGPRADTSPQKAGVTPAGDGALGGTVQSAGGFPAGTALDAALGVAAGQ